MDTSQLPLKYRLLIMVANYNAQLNESPLLTKGITGGVLGFLEEFAAQSLTYVNGRNYQWSRMFKMAAYNFFISAPLGHYCYAGMGRLLGEGEGLTHTLLQLGFSNGIILPIQTYVYIVAMGLIAEKSWSQTQELLKKTFIPVMVTTWKFFPIIQLLVFKYVPQVMWVPVFNFIGLLFGVWINATTKSKDDAHDY